MSRKVQQEVERADMNDHEPVHFHAVPSDWHFARDFATNRLNSQPQAPNVTQSLKRSNTVHDNIWIPSLASIQIPESPPRRDHRLIRHEDSSALDRIQGRQRTESSEQILLIDNMARLFHVLSQHYRAIALELTICRDGTGTQKFEQNLTSVFHVVLQVCELITSTINHEANVKDTNRLLATYANTTVSVMTAKTIIDLYDLVLGTFETDSESLTSVARETANRKQQVNSADRNSTQVSRHFHDMDKVIKTREQMETMDFHIVHLEAVCRKIRDLTWTATRSMSSQIATTDSTDTVQMPMSQSEAIDRLLNAATSTRQEIRRLKAKANNQ